jgi:hypothetical protein
MRVGSFAVARPSYYDRNAVSTTQQYGVDLAPHATTTRWTATVAAGKKQFVEFARTSIYRTSVASVGSLYEDRVRIAGINFLTSTSSTNTVGAFVQQTVTGAITLYEGDVIIADTYDLSTGGTVFHTIGYRATQFDA